MNDDDRWAGLSEGEIEAVMVDRFWRSVRGEAFTPDAGWVEQARAEVMVGLIPPGEPVPVRAAPDGRAAEHQDDADCWCQPVLEYVGPQGQEVWAHRDGNGAGPPPVVIAQAIVEALMDGEED